MTRAAESLHPKYPNTEFHVVGGCEDYYADKLKALNDKGIIIYYGNQSDVRPFFGMVLCKKMNKEYVNYIMQDFRQKDD